MASGGRQAIKGVIHSPWWPVWAMSGHSYASPLVATRPLKIIKIYLAGCAILLLDKPWRGEPQRS
jgi:hypothetical protein